MRILVVLVGAFLTALVIGFAAESHADDSSTTYSIRQMFAQNSGASAAQYCVAECNANLERCAEVCESESQRLLEDAQDAQRSQNKNEDESLLNSGDAMLEQATLLNKIAQERNRCINRCNAEVKRCGNLCKVGYGG